MSSCIRPTGPPPARWGSVSIVYELLKNPAVVDLPSRWTAVAGGVDAFLLPACDAGHWFLVCIHPDPWYRIVLYDSLRPTPTLHARVATVFGPQWTVEKGDSWQQGPTDNNCALWTLHNLETLLAMARAGESLHTPPVGVRRWTGLGAIEWVASRRSVLIALFERIRSTDRVLRRQVILPAEPVMVPPHGGNGVDSTRT